jgi:hypothetical protein
MCFSTVLFCVSYAYDLLFRRQFQTNNPSNAVYATERAEWLHPKPISNKRAIIYFVNLLHT